MAFPIPNLILLLEGIKFPINDPILLFSVILFIILLAPVLLKKLRIPSIIGLIIAGVFIGPKGFNVISLDGRIDLFGKIGLLYIMFLAGLELDLSAAIKNKNKSIVFGALTFFIPLLLGFPVCLYFLHLSPIASLMVASMFSTHTLVAYPITSRMGISKNPAVTIAVGGTIITDTAVLVLLAVITSSIKGELTTAYWIKMIVSFILFGLFIFGIIPIIGRWFFKNIESEKTSQFIFVLATVFLCAFLSQVAGIEPIVGAFFAGLTLNRLIPHQSDLMNKIEFVGNALFIPFFLISVGMLVDMSILFKGNTALKFAVTLTIVAITVKWLAAFVVQKIYKLDKNQRRLIWGLSNAHAAAIMAVALIGFKLNILDENILNGTIILILVTCLIASFVTENASRSIVLNEQKKGNKSNIDDKNEKIIIAASNDDKVELLLETACLIKNKESKNPIFSLTVVNDSQEGELKMATSKQLMEKVTKLLRIDEAAINIMTRVDFNIANGISSSVKELSATDVIIGWSDKSSTADLIFGGLLENIKSYIWENIYVCKLSVHPLRIKNIYVVFSEHAEYEKGFHRILQKLIAYTRAIQAKLMIYAVESTIHYIKETEVHLNNSIDIEFLVFDFWRDFTNFGTHNNKEDLMVVVSARKGTISYNEELNNWHTKLARSFEESNFILIYPQQLNATHETSIIQASELDVTHVQKNIRRLQKYSDFMKSIFKK
jgi:Kef-type K+ transport system membrane component KefB